MTGKEKHRFYEKMVIQIPKHKRIQNNICPVSSLCPSTQESEHTNSPKHNSSTISALLIIVPFFLLSPFSFNKLILIHPLGFPSPSPSLSFPFCRFLPLSCPNNKARKRLQFISKRSGWRPHLRAPGNSIRPASPDEWVTSFRLPVNMCLPW